MMKTLVIIGLWFLAGIAPAAANDCHTPPDGNETDPQPTTATFLSHQFDSGAEWSLCWRVDEDAGLILTNIDYTAPELDPRQVLQELSMGQLLFRYDQDISPTHLLTEPGLGGAQHVSVGTHDCGGGKLLVDTNNYHLCQNVQIVNHLTDARRMKPLMRHELSLHAFSRVGTHQFEQIFRFSNDGEISPSLVHSGAISRFTDDPDFGIRIPNSELLAATATLLVNWRMDFNINGTASNDQVDEFEFLATGNDDSARTMTVMRLDTETARTINSKTFRGWRISDESHTSGTVSDTTRVGYYLDPQTAGFGYTSQKSAWPNADFFVTTKHECEKLASYNSIRHSNCGDNLDVYLNDEPLLNNDIITWYSISHQFTPQAEDFPAISARKIGFKLIPFDWSAHSTFAPEPEMLSPVTEISQ